MFNDNDFYELNSINVEFHRITKKFLFNDSDIHILRSLFLDKINEKQYEKLYKKYELFFKIQNTLN